MATFRKKPVEVNAHRWFKNGDHPEDYSSERPFMEHGSFVMKPGSFFKEHDWDGLTWNDTDRLGVANYCSDDVALERDLVDFVDRHGYVISGSRRLVI